MEKTLETQTQVLVEEDGFRPDEDSMAYKQTRVRALAMGLVFMSSWEAISQNTYSAFLNGGPSSLSWGLLIAAIGGCAQSASLAEMSAIQPIAGAQYHWTWLLAPPKSRRFITWMQAWITWFAWISIVLGVGNVSVTMIESVALLNYPQYTMERWHTTLIIWAALLFFGLVNIFIFRIVPHMEMLSGTLHIVMWVVTVVVLLIKARGNYNDNHFVWFTTVDSHQTSGWSNSYVSWNLGLLASCWGFVGFDNAAHLGEEVRKAHRGVPRVLFFSIAINAVFAWTFILALLYTMRSMDDALNAPAAFPLTGIIYGVTGSLSATNGLMIPVIYIGLSNTSTSLTSVSRLTWAWARDGGLPKTFSIVNERLHVPIKAVILPAVIAGILAILNIPSTIAFQIFIALGTLGLYASYFVAISCMLYARLTRTDIPFGGWRLGRWGLVINLYSLVYTAYMSIWLCCPASMPITGANMNYTLPIFLFFLLVALVLWVFKRKTWPGVSEKVVELALKE